MSERTGGVDGPRRVLIDHSTHHAKETESNFGCGTNQNMAEESKVAAQYKAYYKVIETMDNVMGRVNPFRIGNAVMQRLLKTTSQNEPSHVSTGQNVKLESTPMTREEIVATFRRAWIDKFGTDPSHQTLRVLCAKVDLEVNGGKSLYNHNFGNITQAGKYNYTLRTAGEWDSKAGKMVAVEQKYRAYPNAMEGARDYLNFLDGKLSLKALENGDANAFAYLLKSEGYFTAPVETQRDPKTCQVKQWGYRSSIRDRGAAYDELIKNELDPSKKFAHQIGLRNGPKP